MTPSPLTAGLIILATIAAIAWAIREGARGPNTRRDRRTPPTASWFQSSIDEIKKQREGTAPPPLTARPRSQRPDRTPPVRTLNQRVRSPEQKPQTLGTPPPGSPFAERTNGRTDERDDATPWDLITDDIEDIDITKEPYAKEHLADLPEDEQKEIMAMRQRMNAPTPLPTEDAEATEYTTDLRQRVHALLNHFGSEGISYRTLAELAGCSLSMAHKYGKELEIQQETTQEAIEEREDAGTDNEGWYTDKDRIWDVEQGGSET